MKRFRRAAVSSVRIVACGLLAAVVSSSGAASRGPETRLQAQALPGPASPLLASFEQHQALRRASEFGLQWYSVGPVMNSARAASVQGDPARPGTMYVAFGPGNLWKTTDHGLTWTPIFENQPTLGIGDFALAPSRPETIWLGTGVNLKKPRNFTMPGTGVFRSDDGGLTWRNTGLPDSYHIGKVAVHPRNPEIVFVAVPGINDDDLGCHLFVSEDRGGTWTSIRGNLPDEVAYVILEDPANENILYVGLLRGVYVSTDRGRSWSLLGPNMPAAAVSDLAIQEREQDLVASTYGRGIRVMNIRPIREAFADGAPAADRLFEPPAARLPWINDSHRDPRLSTVEKTPLTFFLTRAADVTLSVWNAKGETVWSTGLKARKGFNQVRWDLVTKTADSPEPYFTRFREFAPAGDYEVRVAGGGIDLRGRLTVVERDSPPRH